MVRNPYALDESGTIVPVKRAERGLSYRCRDCDRRMIPKLGPQRIGHYAHYGGGDCISMESSLHKRAKREIIDGVESARRGGSTYPVELICSRCGSVIHRTELNADSDFALEEYHVTPRLRPDVSFLRPDPSSTEGLTTVAAVEVVVSNEASPGALAEYDRIGVPVFVVRPSLETVEELRRGIRTTEGINVHRSCGVCARRESEKLLQGLPAVGVIAGLLWLLGRQRSRRWRRPSRR